jgi:hypothetical protein
VYDSAEDEEFAIIVDDDPGGAELESTGTPYKYMFCDDREL